MIGTSNGEVFSQTLGILRKIKKIIHCTEKRDSCILKSLIALINHSKTDHVL